MSLGCLAIPTVEELPGTVGPIWKEPTGWGPVDVVNGTEPQPFWGFDYLSKIILSSHVLVEVMC